MATPNRSSTALLTQQMNLKSLKRHDPAALDIIKTASHVVLYKFESSKWERMEVEGTLFLYSRQIPPLFAFIIMNRLNMDNFIGQIMPSMELQITDAYLIFKSPQEEIYGVWFFKDQERIDIGEAFEEYSKLSLPPYEQRILLPNPVDLINPREHLLHQHLHQAADVATYDMHHQQSSGNNPLAYIASNYSSPVPQRQFVDVQPDQHMQQQFHQFQHQHFHHPIMHMQNESSMAVAADQNDGAQHLEALFRRAAERAVLNTNHHSSNHRSPPNHGINQSSPSATAVHQDQAAALAASSIEMPSSSTAAAMVDNKSFAGILKKVSSPQPQAVILQNGSVTPSSSSMRKGKAGGAGHRKTISTSEAAAVLPRPFVPKQSAPEGFVKPEFAKVQSAKKTRSKGKGAKGGKGPGGSTGGKKFTMREDSYSSDTESDDEDEDEELQEKSSDNDAILYDNSPSKKQIVGQIRDSVVSRKSLIGTVVEMSRPNHPKQQQQGSDVNAGLLNDLSLKSSPSKKGKKPALTKPQFKKRLLKVLEKDTDLLDALYTSYLDGKRD